MQETKCLETQVPNAFHIPTAFVLELYNLYFAEVHFPIATRSYEEATEQRGKTSLTLVRNAPPLDKLETYVFTKHQISFGLAWKNFWIVGESSEQFNLQASWWLFAARNLHEPISTLKLAFGHLCSAFNAV